MNFLVISQYPERREEIKSMLRQLDRRAQMLEAADWSTVESVLQRERRDMIVADLMEPSSHRAAVTLARHFPGVAIAVIANVDDAAQVLLLLHGGVRAVIPRDFDWRSVIRALELVLLGNTYVPAQALDLTGQRSASGHSFLEAAERSLPYRRRLMDSNVLSPRQQQIMRLIHMGSTNKGIARALGISEGTVKIHLATIFKILGANNRAAAVAIYNGWLFDQVQQNYARIEGIDPNATVAADASGATVDVTLPGTAAAPEDGVTDVTLKTNEVTVGSGGMACRSAGMYGMELA